METTVTPEQILEEILKDQRTQGMMRRILRWDEMTYLHSIRVGRLTTRVGIEVYETMADTRTLGRAGLLHDIGKLIIPQMILRKNGTMNSFEIAQMRTHPRWSGFYLSSIYDPVELEVALAHHEYQREPYPRIGDERREDGERHERRRNNQKIKDMTLIVALADHYDALRSQRPYKTGMEKEEVERMMREVFSDTQYFQLVLSKGD